jgi:sulfur transfer protein SufE
MSNYLKKLNNLLENFLFISDQHERMDFLIDYADKFKEVPSKIASRPFPEENKVPFCESGAYVWTTQQPDGTLKFFFAVENPQGISAKALSTILDKTLSGETPENILRVPEDIVIRIFGESLSMGKNMGLTGILQKIQRDAKKYLTGRQP